MEILKPISNVKIVNRSTLRANDYNPNKVLKQNMDLLLSSIMTNGWTMPIVARPDGTIIDGFHRWTLSGMEPLVTLLKGKVPVVYVDHDSEEKNIYGTVTHNRARGVHLLEPMEKIVQSLLKKGIDVHIIAKQLGMKKEEVWRLSGMDREDFLEMMIKDKTYSKSKAFKAV